MALPAQGMGTSTPWTGDDSYDASAFPLPNDGSQWSFATVMLLIARLINNTGHIYKRTIDPVNGLFVTLAKLASALPGEGASMVTVAGGTDGTGFSIPPGLDLESLIGWLSMNVPGLAFLGDTTAGAGGNGKGSGAIGFRAYTGATWGAVGSTSVEAVIRSLLDGAWPLTANVPKATGRASTTLSATGTSITIDLGTTSTPIFEQHFTGAAGSTINITVKDFAGSPANPEIEIVLSTANQTGSTPTWYIRKDDGTGFDGTVIARFDAVGGGAASHGAGVNLVLRWKSGAWHCIRATTSAAAAIAVTNAVYS